MNGEDVKRFWHDFSFWKFVVAMVFVTGFNYAIMQMHIDDERIHLSAEESAQLYDIRMHGFTYSQSEKIEIERRLTAIETTLLQYVNEGRLETPDQKTKRITEAFRKLLSENGYRIIKE